MFEESKQSPPRVTSYQHELDNELLNDREDRAESKLQVSSSNNRANAEPSNIVSNDDGEFVAESGLTNTNSIGNTNNQQSIEQIKEHIDSKPASVTVEKELVVDESQKPSSPADTATEKFEKHAADHLTLQQQQNSQESKKVPDTLQER